MPHSGGGEQKSGVRAKKRLVLEADLHVDESLDSVPIVETPHAPTESETVSSEIMFPSRKYTPIAPRPSACNIVNKGTKSANHCQLTGNKQFIFLGLTLILTVNNL